MELGLTVLDTAEMYGDGATESFVGEALAGLRDDVVLVSKAYPQNAGGGRLERACEASLKRLRPMGWTSTFCIGAARSRLRRRCRAWRP